MQSRVPAANKKVGVCYAVTDDGLELPVIDVTHPAFALSIGEPEVARLLQEHAREVESRAKVPACLQRLMLGIMQKQSRLMRGINAAAGGYMSGMNTYIMKLGPDNLDRSFASGIDRQIAVSFPALTIRLRLQDVAHLLADGLIPALENDARGTLHLLNIGGGPSIDSLNALILIQKEHPKLLTGRQIFVHSLDPDTAGPSFGRRALAALQAEGAPLHGLEVWFDHVDYDWSIPSTLQKLVGTFDVGRALVVASSEGALFEYGSDSEITHNLQMLHSITPAATIVAGSVTRADEMGVLLNAGSAAALQLRGLEAFTSLARSAGWTIDAVIDRPISHNIRLKKKG